MVRFVAESFYQFVDVKNIVFAISEIEENKKIIRFRQQQKRRS